MNTNTLYVAYGSNLNVKQMEQRCPSAKVYGIGIIPNYRLVFKALGIYAYATIEPCEGDSVPVAVWNIERQDEISLDHYEGFPTHYEKEMVDVVIEDNVMKGMVYVMNQRAVPALPSRGYFDCVLSGYRSFQLDEQKLFEAWHRVEGDFDSGYSTLKYYRQKRSLTQAQLASKAGLSVRSVQKYESGERSICRARADITLRLATVLDISPYFLMK